MSLPQIDMEFHLKKPVIGFDLSTDTSVKLDFGIEVAYGKGGRLPDYTGDYEVTPKLTDQTLPTKDKSMTDDVVVKEVPVARVSNPSGGKTCTICAL